MPEAGAHLAVLGTFLVAITLYVYGTLVVIQLIWHTLEEFRISVEGGKHLQVVFIEMPDVFLLGTGFFIVAFGLFQLFVQPDLPVLSWLKIRNLDQLTERLIELGAAVAIVIAAFSLLLVVTHRRPEDHGSSPGELQNASGLRS